MSRRSPYRIELTAEERSALERRTRRQTATRREVFRAQVVLLAASGLTAVKGRWRTTWGAVAVSGARV